MKNSKLFVLVISMMIVIVVACGSGEEGSEVAPEAETSTEPAATPFDPATGTATLSGKVALEGTPAAARQIKMNADPNCVRLNTEPLYYESVIANDGNLQNVFVYVKEGMEKYTFTPPAEPATINQKGCHYVPHVGGMMVNQTLKIINSDPTLHNIHCWAEKNRQFNIGQPIKDMVTKKKFATQEVMVPFRCDVHKWMSAYLAVLPHPFFSVSDADGAFRLANLPPGDYVIEAWHEQYGTQTQNVTVSDHETKEITFTFTAG